MIRVKEYIITSIVIIIIITANTYTTSKY